MSTRRAANQITGPNAGGPRQFPIRTPRAARVGQFWRWAKVRLHRMVVGLNPMPDFENLFLKSIQFAGGQSRRRQHGLPLILCDTDENVAAAQVVKIIGEGAHRVQDGLRIPALLELQPLPLHGLSVQDVIDVDRQRHCRGRIGQNRLRENLIIFAVCFVRHGQSFTVFTQS